MDILQAVQILRPGTAWNYRGCDDGTFILEQAIDGSPRVDIPSQEELDVVMNDQAQQDPKDSAKVILKDPNATLQDRVDAIQTILGL